VTHVTGNEHYAWLNNALCALAGEVRPREDGSGFDVVFDVSELIWEPLSEPNAVRPRSTRLVPSFTWRCRSRSGERMET
jgi:hypothetical protein